MGLLVVVLICAFMFMPGFEKNVWVMDTRTAVMYFISGIYEGWERIIHSLFSKKAPTEYQRKLYSIVLTMILVFIVVKLIFW